MRHAAGAIQINQNTTEKPKTKHKDNTKNSHFNVLLWAYSRIQDNDKNAGSNKACPFQVTQMLLTFYCWNWQRDSLCQSNIPSSDIRFGMVFLKPILFVVNF